MGDQLDPLTSLAGDASTPLLVAGRTMTDAAMERLMSQVAQGDILTKEHNGSEYLLFTCGRTPCAVPLAQLREVLPSMPTVVPLPFSPPWLLGVFPLRADLLAMLDPAPILLGTVPSTETPTLEPMATLVAGDGEELLGLTVAGVGDIALVQPDEIVHDPSLDAPQVAVPYAAGHYVPPESGAPHAVINLPRLLDDLLTFLKEAAAHE